MSASNLDFPAKALLRIHAHSVALCWGSTRGSRCDLARKT